MLYQVRVPVFIHKNVHHTEIESSEKKYAPKVWRQISADWTLDSIRELADWLIGSVQYAA